MNPGFLGPLVDSPDEPFALENARTGGLVARRIEPAFDSDSRRKGLMGRDGLAAGTALVIAPSNSVHTFFMRFPIDIVYARRDGQVLKVRHGVPPWRISASLRAFAVVELPAGAARMAELEAGDRLVVRPANHVQPVLANHSQPVL